MSNLLLETLRFYTDTHIDKQVAIQLRQRGIEVTRCEEVGLAEASDEAHLQYASQHILGLITKDEDFRRLHFEWLARNQHHAGIFFCADRHRASIGNIVKACEHFALLVQHGAASLADIQDEFFDITGG